MASKPATDNGANEYKYPTFTSVVHAILWYAEVMEENREVHHHLLEVVCESCEVTNCLIAPSEAYAKWVAGALIQDALPMLSPQQRDLLLGLCPTCLS